MDTGGTTSFSLVQNGSGHFLSQCLWVTTHGYKHITTCWALGEGARHPPSGNERNGPTLAIPGRVRTAGAEVPS